MLISVRKTSGLPLWNRSTLPDWILIGNLGFELFEKPRWLRIILFFNFDHGSRSSFRERHLKLCGRRWWLWLLYDHLLLLQSVIYLFYTRRTSYLYRFKVGLSISKRLMSFLCRFLVIHNYNAVGWFSFHRADWALLHNIIRYSGAFNYKSVSSCGSLLCCSSFNVLFYEILGCRLP